MVVSQDSHLYDTVIGWATNILDELMVSTFSVK